MNNLTNDRHLIKSFIIILLCFVIDSTISYFLPYNFTKTSITLTPYFSLMMFCMLVKTIEGAERYFFASICGVYYSVVYTNSLAIYILIFALIAFVRSYIYKFDKLSFFEMMIFCVLTIFSQEFVLYWLMKVTGITFMKVISVLLMRILPTIGLNIVLYVFVYVAFNLTVSGE